MTSSREKLKKNSWYFTRWNGSNIAFAIQHIHDVLRIFTDLQIFFYIYPLKWEIKWTKFWVQSIQLDWFLFETLNYFYVLGWKFIFQFFNGQRIHNVVLMLPIVAQIDIIGNVESTLLNVGNCGVDIHVSTLTWRCPASWRHINLAAMLKQRWNVCWDLISLN